MKRLSAILALILALSFPTTALAHGKNASHDGCGATHSLRYDGYSGGKYWYHSMRYDSFFVREQIASHYWRGGPPSNPVYYYSHQTTWICV